MRQGPLACVVPAARRDQDHIIFEMKQNRGLLVEFIQEYAKSQEDVMAFEFSEKFTVKDAVAGCTFKFNDLRRHRDPPADFSLQGYVEVKDFEPETGKGFSAMPMPGACEVLFGESSDLGRPWMRRYFVLIGYQLNIYDIQPIEGDLSIRVLVKTIEITERLHLKELCVEDIDSGFQDRR